MFYILHKIESREPA